MAQGTFDLRGYVLLVGNQIGWQAGEGLLTFGAEEAAGLVLLFFNAGGPTLTWAGAMPPRPPPTPGTYC